MNLENFASRGLKAQAAVDILTQINASTDAAWLKVVMGSKDYQVSVRSAAQRRLAKLFKKGKRK